MKKLVLASMLTGVFLAPSAMAEVKSLSSEQDKLGYTIGVDLGSNFKKQEVEVNADAIAQGIKDAVNNKKLLLTEEQMRETLQTFQKELFAKRANKLQQVADKNKQEGEQFLTANKTKQGVSELASGLQYKVIKAGSGPKPTANDSVTVEYEGKLLDGKVFDSSKKAGRPVTFKLSQVIPGWSEGLQLMQEGANWELYIPASLAYGERGVGSIGPNETLIFNVYLLKVVKEAVDENVGSTTSASK